MSDNNERGAIAERIRALRMKRACGLEGRSDVLAMEELTGKSGPHLERFIAERLLTDGRPVETTIVSDDLMSNRIMGALRSARAAMGTETRRQIEALGIIIPDPITDETLQAAVEARYPSKMLLIEERRRPMEAMGTVVVELIDKSPAQEPGTWRESNDGEHARLELATMHLTNIAL